MTDRRKINRFVFKAQNAPKPVLPASCWKTCFSTRTFNRMGIKTSFLLFLSFLGNISRWATDWHLQPQMFYLPNFLDKVFLFSSLRHTRKAIFTSLPAFLAQPSYKMLCYSNTTMLMIIIMLIMLVILSQQSRRYRPVNPMLPVAPVGPTDPSGPSWTTFSRPAGPVAPVPPVLPCQPVNPVYPVGPVAPGSPGGPRGPTVTVSVSD